MRIARYRRPDGAAFVGVVEGDHVVPVGPGEGAIGQEGVLNVATAGRPPAAVGDPESLGEVRLLAPIPFPPAVRDFYAFEQHVRTARRLRGLEMDPDWYELPIFYFTNPATVFGDGDVIPYPATERLDYELEICAVMGRDGADLTAAEALDAVAGYMVFNDWSARDLQRREMKLSLGPAKGKDFANSFGPWLVTPDELSWSGPGRPRGTMTARVNGEEWSRADLSDLYHDYGAMIAYASRDSRVRRGDLLGSGTCGTGCILELASTHGEERFPWLRPGDVVELEVEGIGVLRNTVGEPR